MTKQERETLRLQLAAELARVTPAMMNRLARAHARGKKAGAAAIKRTGYPFVAYRSLSGPVGWPKALNFAFNGGVDAAWRSSCFGRIQSARFILARAIAAGRVSAP